MAGEPWATTWWHRRCYARNRAGLRCELRRDHTRWAHAAWVYGPDWGDRLMRWEDIDLTGPLPREP